MAMFARALDCVYRMAHLNRLSCVSPALTTMVEKGSTLVVAILVMEEVQQTQMDMVAQHTRSIHMSGAAAIGTMMTSQVLCAALVVEAGGNHRQTIIAVLLKTHHVRIARITMLRYVVLETAPATVSTPQVQSLGPRASQWLKQMQEALRQIQIVRAK